MHAYPGVPLSRLNEVGKVEWNSLSSKEIADVGPPAWHVVWYMMPISPKPGAPELDWEVAVERANATQCTYWITVKNLTSVSVTYEGRFAVLS